MFVAVFVVVCVIVDRARVEAEFVGDRVLGVRRLVLVNVPVEDGAHEIGKVMIFDRGNKLLQKAKEGSESLPVEAID